MGSHCRLGRPLTPGAAMTGQDVRTGGTGNFGWCLTALGPQLFYSLVVPANRRAVVTTTPTGTPWAPTVQLIGSCSGTTCYSIRNGPPGMPTVAMYEERVGIERTVRIGVAAPEGTTGGTFDLSAAIVFRAARGFGAMRGRGFGRQRLDLREDPSGSYRPRWTP